MEYTLSSIDPDDGTTDAEMIAGSAYQVIGSLAHAAGLFDHPEVQRALDWFSQYRDGDKLVDLLPWGATLPDEPLQR
jgi:hypothetical protein